MPEISADERQDVPVRRVAVTGTWNAKQIAELGLAMRQAQERARARGLRRVDRDDAESKELFFEAACRMILEEQEP